MDQIIGDPLDPRDAIARLEARIEALEDKVENCGKYEAAAKLAIVMGLVVLAGLIVRAIPFDRLAFLAGIAAALGGFVLLGSNSSTRQQAAAELAKAQAERAALIGAIDLRVVSENRTFH